MTESDCPRCEGQGSLDAQVCTTCAGTCERTTLEISPTMFGAIVSLRPPRLHGSTYAPSHPQAILLAERLVREHPEIRLVRIEKHGSGPAMRESLADLHLRPDLRYELVDDFRRADFLRRAVVL